MHDLMGSPMDLIEQLSNDSDFEVTTIEDKILPDGHHIHKETHS